MKRKYIVFFTGAIGLVLAICIGLVSNFAVIAPLSPEAADKIINTEKSVDKIENLSTNNKDEKNEAFAEAVDDSYNFNYSNGRRDFAVPTEEKHAYDPFAKEQTKEATKNYRDSAEYEKGTVIYKVTETKAVLSKSKSEAKNADLKNAGVDVDSATELTRKEIKEGALKDTFEVVYQATTNSDVWQVIDKLSKVEGVLAAQPNYLYRDTAVGVPTVEGNPQLNGQWHYGDLKIFDEWQHLADDNITPGEGSVVAVIDTGVDYNHPDLKANMWVNSKEFNGTKGVDDDGNGYVDDIYGCSTVGAKNFHSGNPMDDHGHGTHVAGIIAMTPNNHIGSAGMAYGVKIMAIKAGQATGVFSDTDIAEAINYAVANGADVINMSFGGYGKSFLVEDALRDAFGHCALVAAAGNDSKTTTDNPFVPPIMKGDMFPAGYSYVIGVMASNKLGTVATFSNWDYRVDGGPADYEIVAPGTDVFSTLPNGKYAYWDGTSMAAPLVSAAASIIRSKYPDKTVYNSRFIMGQLIGATTHKIGNYSKLNLNDSLYKLPKPILTVKNVYLFDDPKIDPVNDGDGIIDAGEVIDLGLVIRNRWGLASDVSVKVDAISVGGVPNPNIEWITDTINMENVGTFSEQNNSFRYDKEALVGTDNPIRFRVKSDTINDANIGFNITITAKNGIDKADSNTYCFNPDGFEFTFFVQRGRALSGIIENDMTLTSDNYWIIENSIYIPEGVTVNVEPGTQLQFWGDESESPYSKRTMAYIEVDGEFNVIGTEEKPVDMFPSIPFSDYGVEIWDGINPMGALSPYSKSKGATKLYYVNIINPKINVSEGNHLKISQNNAQIKKRTIGNSSISEGIGYAKVISHKISNSIFDNITYGYEGDLCGNFFHVLFNNNAFAGSSNISNIICEKCTFLGENKYYGTGITIENPGNCYNKIEFKNKEIFTVGKSKYVLVKNPKFTINSQNYDDMEILGQDFFNFYVLNNLAKIRGGHLAVINSAKEQQDLLSINKNLNCNFSVGGIIKAGNVNFTWVDGSNYQLSNHDPVRAMNSDRIVSIANSGIAFSNNMIKFDMRDYVLLEYPETISDENILNDFSYEEICSALKDSEEYSYCTINGFNNNALLNNFNEVDNEKWNRIATSMEKTKFYICKNNYFGTDDDRVVKKHVSDQNFNFSIAKIITSPYLTKDSPELQTIYPFVKEAYITDMEGNKLQKCGYQDIQVHVEFNRNMAKDILPVVSFGPAEPYTDFIVNGDFVDDRHWVGNIKIDSEITGGSQFIRVKDAAASDDKWLKTGVDQGRFKFSVDSNSVSALKLQAIGCEDSIKLMWKQDDYDTLSGFNIYRSENDRMDYKTKINETIIPQSVREFIDKDVEPGRKYYYYFTVVKTDFKESEPSNVALASALDNIKPILTHEKVTEVNYGTDISFKVNATDNIAVEYVKVFYRNVGDSKYKSVNMSYIDYNEYFATISSMDLSHKDIEYYIEASDGYSVANIGTPTNPIKILVRNEIEIYSVSPNVVDINDIAQGTSALISGNNFNNGMEVFVGDQIVPYDLLTNNQIRINVPLNMIGKKDLKINYMDQNAKLSNAITYCDKKCEAQIVSPAECISGKELRFPISVLSKSSIIYADISLKLNNLLYESVRFEKNPNYNGVMSTISTTNDGLVNVKIFSPLPIDTSLEPIGYLVVLPFKNNNDILTEIDILSSNINGVDTCNLFGCNFFIKPNRSLSGVVKYNGTNEVMSGVKVMLSNGMVTYTDVNGVYKFTDIGCDNVTVTLEYNGSMNDAVSGQDAAIVLQAINYNKTNELTLDQKIAADVDFDGRITSYDVSLILQKSVGIIGDSYTANDNGWYFKENGKKIDLTNEANTCDINAILIGDVTGNWKNSVY